MLRVELRVKFVTFSIFPSIDQEVKEKKEKKMVLGKSQEDRIRLQLTYTKLCWYAIADG